MLTNPAPPPREVEPEQLEPGTFVFVGRLTRQKALGTAIAAIARVPEARLVLVGDGPERAQLDRAAAESGAGERIAFRGALSRDEALRTVAGADAALLSSDWENLPHSAVEALSVGVPGRLDGGRRRARGRARRRERPARAARARRTSSRPRSAGSSREPGLRERLAAAAKPSVAAISSEAIYGRLEALLAEAAR